MAWENPDISVLRIDARYRSVAPGDTSSGFQVNRETGQPVAALVVRVADTGKPGFGVALGRFKQRDASGIVGGQARGDAPQHPGTAEVQAVEMGQLAVAAVGHARDR